MCYIIMPDWMSVLFNGMISGLSVLFLTDLRVQNKTNSEILSCLSYSRVSKGQILVSVLFHTSGPGICLTIPWCIECLSYSGVQMSV